jgi:hypothetical protein
MTDRNAASRSTPLRDALAHILALSKKALPGPWSHKVLRDYNLSPNDNDTPYVYGPDDTKVMCGLWPVHGPKPENVIEAERQTFATIELVAALRNLIQERGDELLSIAQSEKARISDARIKELVRNVFIGINCPDVSASECIEHAIRTAVEEDRA